MKTLIVTTASAIAFAAAAIAVSGCTGTKSVCAEGKGMYANSKTGVVGVGYFDIEAIPEATESAYVRYEEDTALLSPSTKTHAIKLILTGTNSCAMIDSVVEHICKAFTDVAPVVAAKAEAGKTEEAE